MSSFAKESKNLCAADVMTRQIVTLQADYSVRDAAMVLQAAKISGAPVVDESGRAVGIFSGTDLVKFVRQGGSGSENKSGSPQEQPMSEGSNWELLKAAGVDAEQLPAAKVSDYMSPRVVSVLEDASLVSVAKKMYEDRIHRLVVVDGDDRLKGIISTMDLLGAFVQSNEGSADE